MSSNNWKENENRKRLNEIILKKDYVSNIIYPPFLFSFSACSGFRSYYSVPVLVWLSNSFLALSALLCSALFKLRLSRRVYMLSVLKINAVAFQPRRAGCNLFEHLKKCEYKWGFVRTNSHPATHWIISCIVNLCQFVVSLLSTYVVLLSICCIK